MFKVYLDKMISNKYTPNTNSAISKVGNIFDIFDFSYKMLENKDMDINKKSVLFTTDEEVGKKWNLMGGKAFIVSKTKAYSKVTPERIVISENDNDDDICSFIKKCCHIY